MYAKELFKKLVRNAKELHTIESPKPPIMMYGSQRPSDFKAERKQMGRFAHLTDEFIDQLSDSDLETEMVSFIYKCFQQR